MKKIIEYLFLVFPLMFYSQNGKNFYYTLRYISDSTKTDIKKEELFLLNIQEKSKSLFSSVNNIKADSMIAEIRERNHKYGGTVSFVGVPKTKFNYYIEKNIKHDSINTKYYGKIGISNFFYLDNYPLNWKIEKEVKSISGLDCQKATTKMFGRDFVAWFSKTIPISDGPYKFGGLPGLIISLYDVQENFVFTLVNHNPKQIQSIKIPELRIRKLILTDKIKFMKAEKVYKESLIERVKASPLVVDEQRLKQASDRLKSENNNIERFPK